MLQKSVVTRVAELLTGTLIVVLCSDIELGVNGRRATPAFGHIPKQAHETDASSASGKRSTINEPWSKVQHKHKLMASSSASAQSRCFSDPMEILHSRKLPFVIATGDLDGDGNDDLVVGASGKLIWLKHTGGSTFFGDPIDIDTDLRNWDNVAVADLNEDGHLDVVATSNTPGVMWYENGGHASSWGTRRVIDSDNYYFSDVDVGYFDADTHLDIVASYRVGSGPTTDEVRLYQTNGQVANFSRRHEPLIGGLSLSSDLAVADFNHDGIADLVCGASNGGGTIFFAQSVIASDGSHSWDQSVLAETHAVWDVAIGDFNADNAADVAASSRFSGAVSWYESGVDPPVPWIEHVITKASSQFLSYRVRPADVNADGDLDLLTWQPHSSQPDGIVWFVWFENEGGGNFKSVWHDVDVYPKAHVVDLATTDVNGDGFPDIVALLSWRLVLFVNVPCAPHPVPTQTDVPTPVQTPMPTMVPTPTDIDVPTTTPTRAPAIALTRIPTVRPTDEFACGVIQQGMHGGSGRLFSACDPNFCVELQQCCKACEDSQTCSSISYFQGNESVGAMCFLFEHTLRDHSTLRRDRWLSSDVKQERLPSSRDPNEPNNGSPGGMSRSAKIGLIVGLVVAGLLILVVVAHIVARRHLLQKHVRAQNRSPSDLPTSIQYAEMDD